MTYLLEFYNLLATLEAHHHGKRLLRTCTARLDWPERGVYFFFEPGEYRNASGSGLRVVHVGTHAVRAGAAANLWSRLRAHRGTSTGGNHRGSIFRLLVGEARIAAHHLVAPTWGHGPSRSHGDPAREDPVEQAVSQALGRMSLLWLAVDDPPSKASQRAHIERGAIALLSSAAHPAVDPPSPTWLGRHSPRDAVRRSGLWNNQHVDAPPDPDFLRRMELLVARHVADVRPDLPADLFARIRERTKAGDEIRTLAQGRRNAIVDVTDDGVWVKTDRGEQAERIPWTWIRDALEELQQRGSLRQDEIPGQGRYRSAFILALIAAKGTDAVKVEAKSRLVFQRSICPADSEGPTTV